MEAKSSTADQKALSAEKADAREAGLSYTTDRRPGLTRRKLGDSFVYLDAGGKRITDEGVLSRIRALVLPPAWTDVWICPSEKGHLQATGRDARGRKQYHYHPKWREHRDGNKFQHMVDFARALPKIRRQIKKDLEKPGLPRVKVLATVLKLLETTLIRVGNDEYARTNKSYGLTTMHNKHVKISREGIRFQFRGKSGKEHEISLRDRQLARIVKHCQDLPGQELFGYQDEDGQTRDVGSEDVNRYLREITGQDFTAKDYRTWAGTVLAAIALREFEEVTSEKEAKKNVVIAVEAVSRMLGNTPAVCRKCYVHPAILDSYFEGQTIATLTKSIAVKIDRSLSRLKPEEASVLVLLQRRLKGSRRKLSASGRTGR
ncbi:hypothetical protein WJU23_11680 [Prosthecobacter sp. SYSU 5D2]|uniref:DNA topoisomerase IB n=1 Tax=Prosthecobacter sp. SYSU 5D2 TaxID=3134134 RepID=UPI0031FEB714